MKGPSVRDAYARTRNNNARYTVPRPTDKKRPPFMHDGRLHARGTRRAFSSRDRLSAPPRRRGEARVRVIRGKREN